MNNTDDSEDIKELLNRQKKIIDILSQVSENINSTLNTELLFDNIFELLDRFFGFKHLMILLLENEANNLKVIASHGYDTEGIGASTPVGKGVIGMVAKRKRLMRTANMMQMMQMAKSMNLDNAEIKLPGLPSCKSQLAVPLLINDELVGVLSVESEQVNDYGQNDEELLVKIGTQIAIAINNARQFEAIENVNDQLQDLNENLEHKVANRTQELNEKNEQMLASLRYALRIQESLLPTEDHLNKCLGDHLIMYRPKDIVSGDIYWVNQREDKVFFSAIDCTGHGVPGAFVSLVGHSGIMQSLVEFKLRKPSDILDNVNEFIENTINKGSVQDGMDMALCCIDKQTHTLEYSGANNPLFIIRDKELIEIKADKQPVGKYDYHKPFTNHIVELQDNDVIYVFSDGYPDQFGGEQGKKFMKKRFKQLLIEISDKDMSVQKQVLNETLDEWMGNSHPQVDDICVIGVKYHKHNI